MSLKVVLCTSPSLDVAQTIADALIQARLAACVKIFPQVTSVYRWQEKVEHATEVQLVIKTSSEALARAHQLMNQLHPYDVPEWVVIEHASASHAYSQWVTQETTENN